MKPVKIVLTPPHSKLAGDPIDIVEINEVKDLNQLTPGREKKFHFLVPVVEYRSVVVNSKTIEQAIDKLNTVAARRYPNYAKNNDIPSGIRRGKALLMALDVLAYPNDKNFKAKETLVNNSFNSSNPYKQMRSPESHYIRFEGGAINVEQELCNEEVIRS